jgi:hypothetical protein
MDGANMTPYLPVFYFQTYSGDDCRHRFLNIITVLLPASSLHNKGSAKAELTARRKNYH